MKFVLAVFRVIIWYSFLFILAMIGVVLAGGAFSSGAQTAIAFLAPAVGVWLLERRRKSRRESRSRPQTAAEMPPPLPVESPKNAESEKRPPQSAAAPSDPPRTAETAATTASRAPAPHAWTRREPAKPKEETAPEGGRSAFPRDEAAIVPQPRKTGAQDDHAPKRATPKPRHQGWVPKGEIVEIAGRRIDGMIYVGTPPAQHTHGYGEKSRPYIDPSLPLARSGSDKAGHGMPYWPGYSGITPLCRATYLDWLAAGRSDSSYDPGYMFLYFYGLERRFFLDEPSQEERNDLLHEARRLARLYPDNRSVQRYLNEFIEIAEAGLVEVRRLDPVFESASWELPFSLKLGLGAQVRDDEPLDADWALSWLMCDPERRLRTPATRCFEEFRELFRSRFRARHPGGLKVRNPRRVLHATYRAASGEFTAKLTPEIEGQSVPDVTGLRKPVQEAQEIADMVMDELDKYSRFLGRNPDGRGTLEGHALLPLELWSAFPTAEMEALKAWAAEIVHVGGLVPAGDVVARLEGDRPDKIGKRHLTGAADALARLGYGLAPDPRFALRSPKGDEPVVLFDLGAPVEQLEDVSENYRAALMQLALGSFVAHSDGHVAEAERAALMAQARRTDGLSDGEMRRLCANVDWYLAVPPDLSMLRRKLKDAGDADHARLRAAIVAAAHADGVVQSEEVAGIEKLYKALGMDSGLAYSDLHAGEISDGPTPVRAGRSGAPGEAIPDDPAPRPQTLDSARIAAIRSDTERVSSVLGEIFAEDEDTDDVQPAETDDALDGLDTTHAALVRRLVTDAHWSEEAFEALCKTYGLMPAGALEAVNEWSFEIYDEPLLDEYDGYDVSPDVAAAISENSQGEVHHVQAETA